MSRTDWTTQTLEGPVHVTDISTDRDGVRWFYWWRRGWGVGWARVDGDAGDGWLPETARYTAAHWDEMKADGMMVDR